MLCIFWSDHGAAGLARHRRRDGAYLRAGDGRVRDDAHDRTQTLSIAIYDAVQAGNDSLANALVVLISIVIVVVLLLADRWRGAPAGSPAEVTPVAAPTGRGDEPTPGS